VAIAVPVEAVAPIAPAVDTATEVNAVAVHPSATTAITASLAISTPSISSSPSNLYTVLSYFFSCFFYKYHLK